MTRYYYTCPIKALYMMKEFGVRFVVGDQGYYGYEQCLPYTLQHLSNHHTGGKFYVAEESEHIFKPREGDVVDRIDPVPHEKFYKARLGDVKANLAGNWPLRIIMRDNKQFFMPEEEND